MSVITRSALEATPLADLHAIASELGIDGFRRLRKADLVNKIIEQQGGEEAVAAAAAEAGEDTAEEKPKRTRSAVAAAPLAQEGRRRGRRDRRGRGRRRGVDVVATEDEAVEEAIEEEAAEADVETEAEAEEVRPRRRSRGGRGRGRDRDRDRDEDGPADEAPEPRRGGTRPGSGPRPATTATATPRTRVVEGTVELLPNGSGFVRLTPPEPSDDDVYVSAAQVRRCELVTGDTVGGPVREPRRSERYPSLIRIDTINGRPADEVAEGTHFDDLPCALPSERLALGSDDATLKAVEWLTPIGKGSRVTIVGAAHAGKSRGLEAPGGRVTGSRAWRSTSSWRPSAPRSARSGAPVRSSPSPRCRWARRPTRRARRSSVRSTPPSASRRAAATSSS